MTELIQSGIVEDCVKQLGGDEDLVQDVYLVILESIAEHGQDWLDSKRNGGWLDSYIYIVARNKLINTRKTIHIESPIPDEDDGLECLSDRIDNLWALEEIEEFMLGREPERAVLEGWLSSGSFRKLSEDILEQTGHKISHQSLYHIYKDLISKLEVYLEEKGYAKVQGLWQRV